MAEELVLLPQPRSIHFLEGHFPLPFNGVIYFKHGTGNEHQLLPMAQRAKAILQQPEHHIKLQIGENVNATEPSLFLFLHPALDFHPQGYKLTVQAQKIHLEASTEAGLYNGLSTLKQLVEQSEQALPCLHIHDYPDFNQRGVMIDISRDKVPTMDTLFQLVDQLSSWKINQIQLYTEHTFAYQNHQQVWQDASPMTGEEILQLDKYCQARFIELVPNQNSFGHLTRWLKHADYLHLSETPEGFEHPLTGQWRAEPFSLCPLEPETLDLLNELYTELLPHFSSYQLNVGCDETFDLGQGRSKAACEREGKGVVYLKFLQEIHQLVSQQGKLMQFWGDIVLNHPELIPQLPRPIIALNWGYEANHPFERETQLFAEAGIPYYVCPGTSSWCSIAGRHDNAIANLKNAAQYGLANQALGYLITDWGDNGHWQPQPISYPTLAYGAGISWCGQSNQSINLTQVLDQLVFQDASQTMGEFALELGNIYQLPEVFIMNQSALAHILYTPEVPFKEGKLAGLTSENLVITLQALEKLQASLSQQQMQIPDADLIMAEYFLAIKLLEHACLLGLEKLQTPDELIQQIPLSQRNILAKDMRDIIEEYQRIWLQRNREGGLKDSLKGLQKLIELYH